MLSFIFKRLLWALMLFFVITLITFVVFFMLPPASRNAQRNEQGFAAGLQSNYNTRGAFVHQCAATSATRRASTSRSRKCSARRCP